VRIANCSGFFGDRIAAAKEQVEGGPIDVLTGDWLAELTMLILARQRLKHGAGAGYARTFLTQMEQVLGTCLDRGVKVVSNAGGLDPQGLADALAAKAGELGLAPRIAVVTGDELTPRLPELLRSGESFANLDTGETLAEAGITPLTANAYLGGRGIAAALAADADVVITGRVTDAAVVLGPAAWWHGWDFDAAADELAGAVVAGHVIECGAQATGGNYPFFADVPGLEHPGFPIAEIAADGSSVITKHDGTGGMVSVGTVTAQLLYEIGSPAYANPDVTARFDTIDLQQVGRDRVRISGVRGEPAPKRLKVSMNYLGGFRNTISLVLTGLDTNAKADLALRTVTGLSLAQAAAAASPAQRAADSTLDVAELDVTFVPRDTVDAPTAGLAQAHLHLTVKDADPRKVGKPFTAPVVEAALGSYPGMFPTAPPADGTPFGVYWPTTVAAEEVTVLVTLDGEQIAEVAGGGGQPGHPEPFADAAPLQFDGPTTSVAFGQLFGARSGDKGGNANIGVWVPCATEPEAVAMACGEVDTLVSPVIATMTDLVALTATEAPLEHDPVADAQADARYGWLVDYLTPGRVEALLPEAAGLPIEVFLLPNLRAVNIVIQGLLGRGVSDSTRLDPQAKGLAEQLRARLVEVPDVLLDTP
jgi:hypothetical protein